MYVVMMFMLTIIIEFYKNYNNRNDKVRKRNT